MAAHSLRLLSWYCNEPTCRIEALDYNRLVRYDALKVRNFVDYFMPVIEAGAVWLWKQMDERKMKVTHDYYLKKFQLMEPTLRYGYILFDEGQDASPTMLNVFSRQDHARRIIVGDTHQQLYGFRHAVNSLNQVDYPEYALTQSFRFPARIASMAKRALAMKQPIHPYLGESYHPQRIDGLATENVGLLSSPTCQHALIGRTNLELVSAAISLLCIQETIGSLYFEGNFETYTFMDNGVGLNDLVLLEQERFGEIRSPLLRSMTSIDELGDYVDQTGDGQLKTALALVLTYREELPYYIEQIRQAHLPLPHRPSAELLFSTVHRCKGMEYDQVSLCDDFIDPVKLSEYVEGLKKEMIATTAGLPRDQTINANAIMEEINMLYVALTRSKQGINLPSSQYYLQRDKLD